VSRASLCPTCRRRFDDAGFCPFDGTPLAPDTEADQVRPTQHEPRHETLPTTPSPVVKTDENPHAALELASTPAESEYGRLVGQTLDGRYYLESKIGEGGMGVVFHARHAVIERPLAIKVLKREAMRDPATIRRFVQEAKAASRIGHPNIVDITDFGTTPDGMTYSVMEFVAGQTLGAAIRLGAPFAPPRALRITAQIARALAAAHDKGIVHRNLKPDNVFLIDRDGGPDFVKIVDFGIAKVAPLHGEAAEPRLTRAGSVFGTPEYMAPEQTAGRGDADARVDIYALGVILYQMICGRVPHRGENMARTLAMQMLDPIEPPSKARPDLAIAPALERVVMRALAKPRDQRYQTMGELLEALERIQLPAAGVSVTGSPAYTLAALPPGADPGLVPPVPAMPLQSFDADLQPSQAATRPDTPGAHPAPATHRINHEPALTAGDRPPSVQHVSTDERMPARARRLPRWLLLALAVGGTASAVALVVTSRHSGVVDRTRDASLVALPVDAGARQAPRAAVPDATALVALPDPDAGRVLRPLARPGAGAAGAASAAADATGASGSAVGAVPEPPSPRRTVSVQVVTRPEGASLYEDGRYRGGSGTAIQAPLGTKRVFACRLPGYKPGSVEINFNGTTTIATCVMQRIKICIDGIKNPFDDCEIDPAQPAQPAGSPPGRAGSATGAPADDPAALIDPSAPNPPPSKSP